MGIGTQLKGAVVAAAGSLLPNMRLWHIANTETGDVLDGDFEAEEVTRSVSSNWSEHNALNRENPVLQYANGNADKLSFQARFYADNFFEQVKDKIDLLESWTKERDPTTRRPPIVLFWIGNGEITQLSTIDALQNIRYDSPTFTGAVRGATLSVMLTKYVGFELDAGPPPETRNAVAQAGDYFELLAAQEYALPLLGVVLRSRHPSMPIVEPGKTVKLPSLEAIRKSQIVPTSPALAGLSTKKDSPQRDLRTTVIDRLNRSYTSTIVPEGL